MERATSMAWENEGVCDFNSQTYRNKNKKKLKALCLSKMFDRGMLD